MKKVSIARVPALDFGAKEALNTICTNILFSGKKIKIPEFLLRYCDRDRCSPSWRTVDLHFSVT